MKLHGTITIALFSTLLCFSRLSSALPLPDDTLLTVETGANTDAAGKCTTGSCFGMEISPGYWIWTNVAAGTDGGFVIGKNQISGGQESEPSPTNITSGELTAAWNFFGSFGTFYTEIGSDNYFDTESCADIACDGKAFIQSFDMAWNGIIVHFGENGCCPGLLSLTWQVNANGTYLLELVNDAGNWESIPMLTIFRGEILAPVFIPPVAGDVLLDNVSGLISEWIPDITRASNYPIVCSIASPPTNGIATIDPGCAFGSYQSNAGYSGSDSFTYSVASGFISDTGTVNINVYPEQCDPYPLQSVVTIGGAQSESVNAQVQTEFIGRFTTIQGLASGSKNKVTICPGSKVTFNSFTTTGVVSCSINGAATDSSGTLRDGDKLICTNKPDGGDTDRFSVRGGL